MFSQTVEYALRAMVWLAGHPGASLTTEQMSGPIKVPASYLSKVLQQLVRAGLVDSQTGPKGGYRLALKPDQISILNVIDVIEPVRRISTCPLELESHSGRLCPLHSRMDSAIAMIHDLFATSSLADLLREDPHVVPLCVPGTEALVGITTLESKAKR